MNTSFNETMNELGYVFEEQDGKKLTYRKERAYSILVLVIDLGPKYINPILVPKSVILYNKDIVEIYNDFTNLRQDAELISNKSQGKLEVLN